LAGLRPWTIIRCPSCAFQVARPDSGYLTPRELTRAEIRQIIADYPTTLYAVKAPDLYALLQHLRQKPEIDSCYPFGEYLHLTLKEATDPYQFEQQLTQTFSEVEWKPITPTIEDSFIRLMETTN